MTRLRYTKLNEDVLRSSKPVLLPSGTLVDIQLELALNRYMFFDASGDIVSTGTASSLVALKKLVKDTLIASGVTFQTEVRTRKPKTTEEAA